MPVYRSDQALIHVTFPSIDLGAEPWEYFEGGDNTADSTMHLPGGMAPAMELGGIPKRNQITVRRVWSDFLIGAFKFLDQNTGSLRGTTSYTTLNADKTTTGQPTTTYTVTLLGVSRPNYDSANADKAQLQLVFGCDQPIT